MATESSTFGFSVYGPGAVTDVPYEDCNQITIQFDEDPDITTAASLQQVMKGVSVSAILTATGQQTVLGIPVLLRPRPARTATRSVWAA